jgi:Rieske Fe-S protein
LAINKLPLKFLVKIRKMRQLVSKIGKNLTCFILLMVIISSCDKINDSPIPNVHFTYTINMIIANDLSVPGNSVYFMGPGYGGIIVYCEMPGSWLAFDATCTYEASRTCIVKNEGVLAECPCCESQFVLLSGAYPVRSPASVPLKQYNVSLVNENTLLIYN